MRLSKLIDRLRSTIPVATILSKELRERGFDTRIIKDKSEIPAVVMETVFILADNNKILDVIAH